MGQEEGNTYLAGQGEKKKLNGAGGEEGRECMGGGRGEVPEDRQILSCSSFYNNHYLMKTLIFILIFYCFYV